MNTLIYFLTALILFRLNAWEYPIESLLIALLIFMISQNRLMLSEKQLSDEKLGLFLNIIHKTHTPLTLILNLLEELAASDISDSASKEIRRIVGQIKHVIDRYNHVMTFDKIKGNMDCNFKTTESELYGYISALTNECRVYADSHQVQLNVYKNPGYIGCSINDVALTAALQCLVEKVVDVTPQNGCINIIVSHLADRWNLEISNCKDVKKNYKWRFRQLCTFMTVHCCGNLTLIRRIIRLHGGRIAGYKQGSSVHFEITVPLKSCSSIENNSVEENSANMDNSSDENVLMEMEPSSGFDNMPHILVLMDDKELSEYLEKALSNLYRITVLNDSKLISDSFFNYKPAAVIIDSTVNGISGIQLCSEIKSDKNMSNVPVLLLMDSDDIEGYLTYRNSGADELMSRMIHIGKLKADLRALIDGRALLHKQFKRFIDENFPGGLPQVVTKDEADNLFMEQLKNVLEKNLSEEGYTVEKLSSDMGMSHTKLYNTMLRITGKNPRDYMLSFKMDKARLLLFTKQYNVTEISTILGYSGSKYFGKLFKKCFHTSPTEYVKNALP